MAVGLASAAHSQGNPPEKDAGATLFENVRIFDGKGASRSAPSNVLIKGNIIERISTEPIAAEPGVTVIAGNGRTLMPGLIDAHWHAMLIRPNPAQAIVGDAGYNNIAAGVEATATRTNAELLALSGKRSPYAGKLGVVEQGALADLLLVEGNPLENIKLIAEPAKNFKVIMKGGRIYKGLP
jgi:imidazolonepropionase-like amidohydrolase